jgi:hypothetical protein
MVEYGIMVALIAAICVAVVTLLGADVKAAFQTIVDKCHWALQRIPVMGASKDTSRKVLGRKPLSGLL